MIGVVPMIGAECLLRTMAANGVEVCFMNPGTSEMHFVAALDRVAGMRAVLCLYEGVCSGAADGYARMTGRPAATLLHLGPGLANGLSNFHNARKARSPVLSVVGEHATNHQRYDAPLSADIEAFARTVSTEVRTVRVGHELGRAASEAIAAAVRPPGQVSMLIVPADFSWSEAGAPGPVCAPQSRRTVNDECVRSAAKLIESGTGVGMLLSGSALQGPSLQAASRLVARGVRIFAHRNAARMESGRGRFQPARIPYFPEPAEALLSGLQHLLLVESAAPISFFGYPGRRSELAPENCELHTLAATDQDGAAAVQALAEVCGGEVVTADERGAGLPRGGTLNAGTIGQTLAELLPEDAIISDEMLSSGETIWRHLLRAAPHDHMPVTGGSIGQGLPVALGAAMACPGRKVVAMQADGSGMYALQSLWTMAREGLDVVTVILANRRYRILDIEMRRTGAEGFGPLANHMIDIGRPDLDWVKISEGLGVEASRATTADEFIDQFRSAMHQRGPRLIEAVLLDGNAV